ncbi:MAG: sulfatase-like hydrolase/transferase [Candidatus Obscuribacterales bacterium]|nr:sulfatase-like hydrolase/transferase [Candidatus Obscuribacterales bacterium]
MKSRRNVLFISADQWRFECLSAMGHPFVQTPNLDALAKDGVLFRQHFCQTAPCGPARTVIETVGNRFVERVVLRESELAEV